jgi:hypothetical protein
LHPLLEFTIGTPLRGEENDGTGTHADKGSIFYFHHLSQLYK